MATRTLEVVFVGDTKSLDRAFGRASGHATGFAAHMKNMGKRVHEVGKSMTEHITLPVTLAGVAAGKMALDYEESMSKVARLTGASQTQVKAWSEALLRMAGEVGKSPQELADGLYFVASAGIKARDALGVLEVAAKASTAGLGSTQVIADALTSAIGAYGEKNLSAAHAADVLTGAVKLGKGEATAMAKVFGRVAPSAAQMGVSFDEVGGALASMSNLGGSMDQWATRLVRVIATFQKPTGTTTKALHAMGLSVGEVQKRIANQGLLATLKFLQKRMDTTGVSIGQLFPNIRALQGFLALTGRNADKTASIFRGVAHSTGSMQRAFEQAEKTSRGRFDKAFSRLKADAVELGAAFLQIAVPALEKFAGVLDAVAHLPAPLRVLIVGVTALTAAVGPLLIGLAAVAASLAFIAANPIVLAAAAVAALAVAFAGAYATSGHFRDAVNGAFASVARTARGAAAVFVAVGRVIVGWVKAQADAAAFVIRTAVSVVRFLAGLPATLAVLARNIGVSIVNGVLDGLGGLYNALKGSLEGTLRGVLTTLSPFSPVAHGGEVYIGRPLAEGALKGWVLGSAPLPSTLSDTVRAAVEAAQQTVQSLRGKFGDAWSDLTQEALSAFDGVTSQLQTKSEQALTQLQAGHQRQALAQAIGDAKNRLVAAQRAVAGLTPNQGESPDDFAKRSASAQAEVVAAQRQLADALYAQQEDALQQRATEERKALDGRIALRRKHFTKALAQLGEYLTKAGATHKVANAKVLKLLRRFGVGYAASGKALGHDFVTGLRESVGGATTAAAKLAKVAHEPLRKVPGVIDQAGKAAKVAAGKVKSYGGATKALGDASAITLPKIKRLAAETQRHARIQAEAVSPASRGKVVQFSHALDGLFGWFGKVVDVGRTMFDVVLVVLGGFNGLAIAAVDLYHKCGPLRAAFDAVGTSASAVWGAIKAAPGKLAEAGAWLVSQVVKGLEGAPQAAAKAGVWLVAHVIKGIRSTPAALGTAAGWMIGEFILLAYRGAKALVKLGVWTVHRLIDGVKAAPGALADGAAWIVTHVITSAHDGAGRLLALGRWLIGRFVAGVRDAPGVIADAASWLVGRAVEFVHNGAPRVLDVGTWIVRKIADGILAGPKIILKAAEDFVTHLVNAVKDKLGIHSPSRVFHDIGQHVIGGLIRGMHAGDILGFATGHFGSLVDIAKSLLVKGLLKVPGMALHEALNLAKGGFGALKDGISGILHGLFGGGAHTPHNEQLASWLSAALAITGHYSKANLGALYRRAMQESGGNPRAINLWDSNAKAGHPSKGLLQTIDSTFNAYRIKGLGGIWNPIANAVAAIRYMYANYGHIVDANGRGYAQGGVVRRRVGELGPEDLYLPVGSRVVQASESTHRDGPLIGEVNIYDKSDPRMIARELAWQLATAT